MDWWVFSHTNILTGCSQTNGVWKAKKCVHVSVFEPISTGSEGAELMLAGLHKQNIQSKGSFILNKYIKITKVALKRRLTNL